MADGKIDLAGLPIVTAGSNDHLTGTQLGKAARFPLGSLPVSAATNARLVTLELSQSAGQIGYATKAAMDADLARSEGTLGLVTNDPTPANNGTYRKTGASGAGSWVLSADRVTGLGARIAQVEPALPATIAASFRLENLWTDNDFSKIASFTLYPGSAPVVVETATGIPTLKLGPGSKSRSVPASSVVGSTFSVTLEIAENNTPSGGGRILVQQYGGTSEVTGTRQTYAIPAGYSVINQTVKFEGVVLDPATTSIRVFMDAGSTAGNFLRIRNVSVLSGGLAAIAAPAPPPSAPKPYGIVYVNGSTGSDLNDGKKATPFFTVNAAISAITGNGTVVVQQSDIAPFSITGAKNLRIVADNDANVRIFAGTKISSGITKTPGRTKVYQVALASMTNQSTGNWIWQHGVPSMPIPASERHALHRGRTHRLPSTRVYPATSIADIDAKPGPAWFYSGGVLYFSIAGGGSAIGSTIYIPSAVRCVGGGTGVESVEIAGIEGWHGDFAFDMSNVAFYRLTNCRSVGARIQGFRRDGAFGYEVGCSSGGSGNDGFSTHNALGLPDARESFISSFDQWSHDNGDDGCSEHERSVAVYHGGLIEYNGDRGIATAVGAHVTAYGTRTRSNGQSTGSSGEGFGAVGSPVPGNDAGVSTDMSCVSCVAEGEKVGFSASGAGCTMRAVDCKTVNCGTAYVSGNAAANVELIDCGDIASTTLKIAAGPLLVRTTTPVS